MTLVQNFVVAGEIRVVGIFFNRIVQPAVIFFAVLTIRVDVERFFEVVEHAQGVHREQRAQTLGARAAIGCPSVQANVHVFLRDWFVGEE